MKRALLYVACAAALVSCTELPENGKKIKVIVGTEATRSLATTTSSLQSDGAFVMNAYVGDYVQGEEDARTTVNAGIYINSNNAGNVTYSSSNGWSIAGDPTWVEGTPTRFWCWHPVAAIGRVITEPEWNADEISFKYQIPAPNGTTDATNAKDLVFAHVNQKFTGDNDIIDIIFHHALSEVKFAVSTDDGTFDSKLEIKNIAITGIKTSGDATFDGDCANHTETAYIWSNQGNVISGTTLIGQDYNATFETLPVAGWTQGHYTKGSNTFNINTCENAFFMIPQALTSDARITVTFVDATQPAGFQEIKITRALKPADKSVIWEAEKYYTYKIGATTAGRTINLSVMLEDWSDRDAKIIL